MSKIVFYLIFMILGILYTIYRLIRNFNSKVSTNKLIKKIDENPEYANTISESLDCLYTKLPIDDFPDFFNKLSKLPKNLKLHKFHILRIQKINNLSFLLITVCSDTDYNINAMGKLDHIEDIYQMNFLIFRNNLKMQFEFKSELYNDLNEKNLKSTFQSELMKFVKN